MSGPNAIPLFMLAFGLVAAATVQFAGYILGF